MGKNKLGGDGASTPVPQPVNIPSEMIAHMSEAFKDQPEQVVLLMLSGAMKAGPPTVLSLARAVSDWGEQVLKNL